MVWLTIISLLVLMVMTYYNWSANKNIIFLSLYLALFTTYGLTHYWMTIDVEPRLAAIFFNHFTPLYLLVGPLLYFYVKGVLSDELVFKRTDFIHLIPGIIQLVAVAPYIFRVPFEAKVEMLQGLVENPTLATKIRFNWMFNNEQNALIRLGLLLGYILATARLLLKHLNQNNIPISIKLQRSVVLRWLIYLHISTLTLISLYIFFLFSFAKDNSFIDTQLATTIQTLLAVFLVINNLSLLLFPELLFGIPILRRADSIDVVLDTPADRASIRFKDEAYFQDLGNRFMSYMEAEKPYLSKSFNLGQAAQNLEVPQHHLTLCIREVYDDNFSGVRNTFRVKHAYNLLKSGSHSLKTIDAISDESGFSSRTSFYKAFDREFGMSPGDLR